jgi:predicted amidohydrolase
MKDLKITLVQTQLKWEDSLANIKHLNKLLFRIAPKSTDIIVLPEMFNSGFTMNVKQCAEAMNGFTMQWMQETAKSMKSVICGSIIIKEKNKYYNRFIWMRPDGTAEYYNKRHLFSMAKEDTVFAKGNKALIVELKGWKIMPLVCYDLRFPVWSRNIDSKNKYRYDVMINVANWPAVRSYAWQQLLIARAIENQAYVCGVNRVGKDGNEIAYNGYSFALDMLGNKLSTLKPNKEGIETITLNYKDLLAFRKRFPANKDADQYIIK